MKNLSAYQLFFFFVFIIIMSCDDANDPGEASPSTAGEYTLLDGAGRSSSTPGGGSGAGNPNDPAPPAGVITAGEWNDLHHWDFWKSLLSKTEFSVHGKTWGFNSLNRFAFDIKDQNQNPLVDAVIKIKSNSGAIVWEGHTDNSGKAELWPLCFDPQIVITGTTITYKNLTFNFPAPKNFEHGTNTITIPTPNTAATAVDVMFVVDATGSMGDEIEYLKTELLDVLERATQTPNILLRTGSVFYRDKGDDYVTRISNFTTTISTTVDFVKQQSAAGGGDWPEAVHTALQDAITQTSWSQTAKARLLFLVLDAPPHEDNEVKAKVREMTKLAAAKGIKIIPITASGIDKSTEFLMRFISMSTNGSYVFITNHSGIGNEHIEATVGDYEVEFLNDLMVRLIKEYSE
jgi:hypothetical protein